MPDCCVIGCNFRKSVKGTFQSFKFPEDPVQRRIWVDAVKRERKSFILDNETIICKRHFTPDDLVPVFDSRKRQRRPRLKEGAVPTLHMDTEKKPKGFSAREIRKSIIISVRRNNPLKPLQINQETKNVDDESNVTNEPMIKMEDVFDNTIERLDILLDISFEN